MNRKLKNATAAVAMLGAAITVAAPQVPYVKQQKGTQLKQASADYTHKVIITLKNPDQAALPASQLEPIVMEIGKRSGQSLKFLKKAGFNSVIAEIEQAGNINQASFKKAVTSIPGIKHVEFVPHARAANFNDTYWLDQQGYLSGTSATSPGALNSGISDLMKMFPNLGANINVAVIDAGLGANIDDEGIYVNTLNLVEEGSSSVQEKASDADDETCEPGVTSAPYHGLAVSGLIGAIRNNSYGVAGILPNAKITHIKALGRCGTDEDGSIDIGNAIMWAAGFEDPNNEGLTALGVNPNPAKVINLSLGGRAVCPTSVQQAVAAAISEGAHIVAATGNDAFADFINFPANCDGVISVTANSASGYSEGYANIASTVVTSSLGGGDFSTQGGSVPIRTLGDSSQTTDGVVACRVQAFLLHT